MRSYLIPLFIALFLLFSCSGEGYIKVVNDTDSSVMYSVNDLANDVLEAGDTSDVYSITVSKGIVNNIPITAVGEYVSNYNETIALADGETVLHHITPNVASITVVDGSVDSAACTIEGYDTEYYDGNDSTRGKYAVDGEVNVEYGGRYMFQVQETKNWMPGYEYRYELVPNACEIQLNNMHPTWTIYYVYLSRSTDASWGDDQLGNDVIESGYGYIWKADGDVNWDMRVEAGDPHPDSALYVYEFYDNEGCPSDYTWIYEFPTIFSAASVGKIAKTDTPNNDLMKPASLAKAWNNSLAPMRIEKIKKVDAGKAGLKALRK